MQTRAAAVRRFFALISFPALLLAIALPVVYHREVVWAVLRTPEALGAFLESQGGRVTAAYIAFHFARVWVFFIPGDVAQVAGGYLFGWGLGFLYSMSGLALGTASVVWTSRALGVPFVREVVGPRRFARFSSVAGAAKAQIGFLLLFLIPGFPKNVLCFVAGVSPIKIRTFLVVSLLARAPGVLGSSIIGSAAAERDFVLVVAVYSVGALLAVTGLVYRKRIEAWATRMASTE